MPKLPPAPLTRTRLSAPDVPLAQELEGLAPSVGHGRGLLVVQVRRHRRDRPGMGVLAQTNVLGVGSQSDARRREDPVTLRERPDILAHRFDVAGELLSKQRSSRPEDAESQAHGQPDPGGEVESPQLAIRSAHRSGTDSDKHLVVLRNGLGHVPELEDIRRSISRTHHCLHGSPVNGADASAQRTAHEQTRPTCRLPADLLAFCSMRLLGSLETRSSRLIR